MHSAKKWKVHTYTHVHVYSVDVCIRREREREKGDHAFSPCTGSTVFSMDACSLLIPTCISLDWTEHVSYMYMYMYTSMDLHVFIVHMHMYAIFMQVGAYPELRLTDDQLSEVRHLLEPHPPIMCSTNALTNTLLALDGR